MPVSAAKGDSGGGEGGWRRGQLGPAHLAPPTPAGTAYPARRCLGRHAARDAEPSRSRAARTGHSPRRAGLPPRLRRPPGLRLEAGRRVLASSFRRRALAEPRSLTSRPARSPSPPQPGLPSLPWRRLRPAALLRRPAVRGPGARPAQRQSERARPARGTSRGARRAARPVRHCGPGILPQPPAALQHWARPTLAPGSRPRPRPAPDPTRPRARSEGRGL